MSAQDTTTTTAAAASANATTPAYNNEDDEEIINWEEEAAAIIRDVNPHVAHIEISRQLPSNETRVYLNVRTIEGKDYCVQVSSIGFRVVANEFDTIDDATTNKDNEMLDEGSAEGEGNNDVEVYETPYALLDKISPSYVESFGNQLCKQLLSVQQMRTQFNEEDEEGVEEDEDDDDDANAAS